MADTKISALTSGSPAQSGDLIPIARSGVNYSITAGSVAALTSSTLTVGTTATSGGAAGQLMFDTGSALQESSGLVWDNTNKALSTLGGGTVTTSNPVINATQTWNNAGTTFTGIKLNVTNTASASGSLVMDLQVGGASQFSVTKAGSASFAGAIVATANSGTTFANADIKFGASGAFLASASNLLSFGSSAGGYGGSLSYGGIQLLKTGALSFEGASAQSSGDVFLTRRGTANFQLGLADAASPVAQTLSVQSVVAGTTDTAGADFTIRGSAGTGTGAGGQILFQTAPAGASTGSAQNALVTRMSISSGGTVTVALPSTETYTMILRNTATSSALVISDSTAAQNVTFAQNATAFAISSTTQFLLGSGGVSRVTLGAAGNVTIAAPTSGAALSVTQFSTTAGIALSGGTNPLFQITDGTDTLKVQLSSGNGAYFGATTNAPTRLISNNTERLVIAAAGNVTINAPGSGVALTVTPFAGQNAIVAAGSVKLGSFTVAGLPAAATVGAGSRAFVTDGLAPTFMATVAGGGAVLTPVYSDGTNWRVG